MRDVAGWHPQIGVLPRDRANLQTVHLIHHPEVMHSQEEILCVECRYYFQERGQVAAGWCRFPEAARLASSATLD